MGQVVIVAREAQTAAIQAALPEERPIVLTDRRHLAADLVRLAPAADVVLELPAGPPDDDEALAVPGLCAGLGLPCAGGAARALALCADRGALGALAASAGVTYAGHGAAAREVAVVEAGGRWTAEPAHEPSSRLAALLASRWGVRDVVRLAWTAAGELVAADPRPTAAQVGAVVAAVRARAPRRAAAGGPVYVNGPVYVAPAGAKGHGLFAARALRKGERVEEMPVVVLDARAAEKLEEVPILEDYEFVFGEEDVAMAIGNAAFINYADAPNVDLVRDLTRRTITIQALRDVAPGEELLYRYRCGAWFDVA